MNILITGKPGVGKTTVIQKVLKGREDVSGFFTQEMREGGGRVGFSIETFDGKKGTLAHVDFESPFCVSKYKVNIKDIEEVCVPSLNLDSGFIVIDEIGKMELFSEKFRKKVTEALDTGKVVATVMEKSHPFTDSIKRRRDVKVFTVTENNRDVLVDTLRKELRI